MLDDQEVMELRMILAGIRLEHKVKIASIDTDERIENKKG